MADPAGNPTSLVQLASFRLGSEDYAIDIMRIREIIRPPKLTPVPDATGLLEGVLNLRGAIIPVVDLRSRLGLPALADHQRTKLVICVVQNQLVGFRVDEVLEVVRLPSSQIRPSPRLRAGQEPGLVLGVCQHHDRLLLLLNLKRVLSPAFFSRDEGDNSPPAGPDDRRGDEA
ncbi:MAG TPA: chemotaxis protein CheW [Myxococcota bacterium]|nr:chemotaxis protein CheW [Myxococcota bacterium]HRY92692.1 chemotaxis protein CheW [Myxococcota bacterium]HSA22048.1 chemotaxis protein CheW [Myxococcota bacterium]